MSRHRGLLHEKALKKPWPQSMHRAHSKPLARIPPWRWRGNSPAPLAPAPTVVVTTLAALGEPRLEAFLDAEIQRGDTTAVWL